MTMTAHEGSVGDHYRLGCTTPALAAAKWVFLLTAALLMHGAPALSQPDGKIVYVRTSGGVHLWMMNTDGSDKQQLTFGDEYDASPSWSPDDQRIVFVARPEADHERGRIVTVDPRGEDRQVLTPTPGAYADPRFSPDGSRVLFSRQEELGSALYVMSASGGDERRLEIRIDSADPPALLAAPSWSPDGQSIAFVAWRESDPTSDRGDLFRADADGRRVQRLTEPSGRDWFPIWSPNGDQIAFQRYHSPDQPHGIYLVGAKGGPVTHIFQPTGGGAGQPSWSPDGQWLAFMYNVHGQDVWTMRSDGSDVQRLTSESRSDYHPSWSTSGIPIPITAVAPTGWGGLKRLFGAGR